MFLFVYNINEGNSIIYISSFNYSKSIKTYFYIEIRNIFKQTKNIIIKQIIKIESFQNIIKTNTKFFNGRNAKNKDIN